MSEIVEGNLLIQGAGGGGDTPTPPEQRVPVESPDSLHSISYAKVLDLISEGEIYGLVNGNKSIYYNETPLQNADGSYNFSGVQIDTRNGTQTQDYIPGFPDVENTISVNIALKSAVPYVRSINNTNLSAYRVNLQIAALSQSNLATGDLNGYTVSYTIELSTDGGAFTTVVSTAFSGKTTSAYQRSHRINLPKANTNWAIRVTKTTPDANLASIQDSMSVVSVTEIIDLLLRYPMSAIIGTQIDAQQFSGIPTRSFDVQGRLIKVPTNYDPVARTYTGVWDGTFKIAYCNNPAWVFYDLVLNDRYGLGNRIKSSQLDRYGLYAIAKYCDQSVADGKGGFEPRFTTNVYIQTKADAYRVLQDLATVFRGLSYWGGGQITVTSDSPSDPVYTYTAANVIGGKFNTAGSPLKSRYTVALVSWNDPQDFYRVKVEPVQDITGIARYGIQQISLTAFGCTSQGQAQRVGAWATVTSRLETSTITFSVGLDGAICMPGQIVRVADPARMGRRNAGRINFVSGRVVTVDKAAVINVGDSFTCILPTGVAETHKVVSVSSNAVTVDADWSVLPNIESIWSVDNVDLVAPTYKVLTVNEKDATTYEITALQHEPGKYAYIDSGTVIQPRPNTVVPLLTQVAPTNLALSTYDTTGTGTKFTTMLVSWIPAAGASKYSIEWRRNNSGWQTLGTTSAQSIELKGIYAGTYNVRIWAINNYGLKSSVVTTPDTVLSGNLGTPADVPYFLINGDVLTWGQIVDSELSGYIIRYHYGSNPSWGDASPLVSGIVTQSPYQLLNKPQGTVTIMIKAINFSGGVSANAALVATNLGDPLVANVLQTYDYKANSFPGVASNLSITGGNLVANSIAVFYGNTIANFYTADTTLPFYNVNYSSFSYETTKFKPARTATGLQMTLNAAFAGSKRLIEYKITDTDLMYNALKTSAFFNTSTTAVFYPDASVYQPWPGSILATINNYKFRFTGDTGSTQGNLSTCIVTIDVPDVTEKINSVAISASGTRLPITKSYLAITNVQLTLQSSGTAFVAKYADKNNTLGPLIYCQDISGNNVAGTVDAQIQGY